MQSVQFDNKKDKKKELCITSNDDSSSGTIVKYEEYVIHKKIGSSSSTEEQNKLRLKLDTTSYRTTINAVLNEEIEEQMATNVDLLSSGHPIPDRMLVQIKSLEFNPLRQQNPNAKKSIRLVIHSVTYHTKSSVPLEEQLKKMFLFPFDYHSFVFDSMKIDIYDDGLFLNTKKKLGRANIQLNTLKQAIINQKEFERTFPLEAKEFPHMQEVGSITINIKFHFPNDPPLTSQTNFRPPAIRAKTAPPVLNSINLTTETDDTDEFDCDNILINPEVRSLGILDMVLCQETREAIKEIKVLYKSFFDNGWTLTKLEFLEAYMLLEKYYAQKPNPVTGNLIQDVDIMQKAQRYLKFSMASYDFFGLDKTDFICWEYGQNAVTVPNYMVIRDPETNSIIVSIRGTMNVADVITDALAHYERWNDGLFHRGVLRSAQYLVDRSLNDIRAAVIKFNANSIHITGHSLGASISSIVTLLLREKCKDLLLRGIDIRAWNFATAPCCSHDLACKTESVNYIYNFVNENDVIPRLSYGNLMDFKELVKFAANELKNGEYKKLKSTERLSKFFSSIDSYRATLKSNPSSQKLYIPGTIHYLYKGFYRSHTKSSLVCYTKDIVCEKSTPDLFTDISLRRNWLFHHFPDRYDRKFKGVIKFLVKRVNEEEIDKIENFWRKWMKMDEIEPISEEGGKRIGKWMSRSGHF
ncbi:7856_t:CDS:10 [Cetraspora pellucida]|uniref:sn-1-specific diacylglycerol lipase n=1 Tax=Cetraspora pellucida TaxID=1433469 RepID=A0A9N9J2G2_9GLOM|nr:7856_t:CDS:10 [Cetraspora pellucida]